ncbi:MAG: Gfo/Idh/MocA family oxidoreductase [Succinimonas sp.]|nr:Gfo/Idh/MocA family oxidoreductase [Succinimonas sp.]
MKIAVIGLNWGRVHLSAYRELGHEITAVVSRDMEKCRRIADEYGIPGSYQSVSELPGSGFDVVSVAVPAAQHYELLKELQKRSCGIVCEKPVLGFLGSPQMYRELSGDIFFNYAYPFLQDMDIFYRKLEEMGPVRSIGIECLYHLDLNTRFTPEEYFYETVSHPVSLMVHKLQDVVSAVRTAPAEILARTASGTELRIVCREDPSLSGIRHQITVTGGEAGNNVGGETSQNVLRLTGEYVTGSPWHYRPLEYNGYPITEEHFPAADPWYTANKASLGNLLRYFAGEQSREETLSNGAFDLRKAMIAEDILNCLKA